MTKWVFSYIVLILQNPIVSRIGYISVTDSCAIRIKYSIWHIGVSWQLWLVGFGQKYSQILPDTSPIRPYTFCSILMSYMRCHKCFSTPDPVKLKNIVKTQKLLLVGIKLRYKHSLHSCTPDSMHLPPHHTTHPFCDLSDFLLYI
jgi:hypothetical protein